MNGRKIIWPFLVIGVLLVIITTLLLSQDSEITNYPSSGQDIIAFGDSLVEGVGASSVDNNFVSLLSEKINRPVINLGISGNTTEDGLRRLSELDKYDPKVVLLLLGGNDRLRRVPTETTVRNLAKLIEEIHRRGAIVILLGVRGNLLSDRFDEEFERLENRYHTAYVPNVLEGIFGNDKYMSDSIHPNDAGYQIISDRVYPVLLEVI